MAKILVIDDEKSIRDLLILRLKRAGHELLDAEDGIIGMEIVRKHKPDLIIIDMFMPRLDGTEVVKELRMFGYEIPIIALTGAVSQSDINKALNAGCNSVITKPISKDFETQIEQFLKEGAIKEENKDQE